MKLPKVSIITCTYNGERIIEEYFEGIFNQNYPKSKIELILADGGSNDKTLAIIEKYKKKYPEMIKFMHNPKQYSIGEGMGTDMATRKAKGEFIVLLDQDNILVQKDWLKNIIAILSENPEIAGVQSRYSITPKASGIDKYINDLGIEDPFVASYSLNAQIRLNPWKFKYNKRGEYFVYNVNKNNFYYAGDNGFVMRKKKFLESGGYTQDIDNFFRMAVSKNKYLIAVPKNVRLHHKTTTSLNHMLQKRIYYAGHYVLKNFDDREFYWFNFEKNTLGQNLKFLVSIISNLAFVPNLIQGASIALKEKKRYWFLHPVVTFSLTVGYIYAFFYTKFFKKQREASI